MHTRRLGRITPEPNHAFRVMTAHRDRAHGSRAIGNPHAKSMRFGVNRKVRGMADANITQANVIAVSFDNDDEAYAGLARLKQLDADGQIELRGAAVATRDSSGHMITKEAARADGPVGMASGGIIGLLVGILGGPLGVLIGGATGVLVGSLFDADEAEGTDSVLEAIAKTVRPGHNTLLAELDEPINHEVVDAVMATRSGTVVRREVRDVEAEIAAAEEAQHKAKKEARKRLREERETKQKADVEAKVAELKAKLPRPHEDHSKQEAQSGVHA